MKNESMSATMFSENKVRLAEEHYRRGNFKRAMEILHALTHVHPNTSTNHRKISQVFVAHQIHWRFVNATLYDVLRISPSCSRQTARGRYMNLMAKLCPEKNRSVVAKLAFKILNATWKVLFDPNQRRRDYNIEHGLRITHQEDELHQSKREGKRPCVDMIDSDSDSD